MSQQTQKFDMIIVGGGPVGLLAAYMLTQQKFQVAVIDRLSYDDILDARFDGRTFAYAYGSKQILEDVGLWQDLAPKAVPIRDIYVTADHKDFLPSSGLHYEAGRIKVDGYDPGEAAMGYNLETRHFRATVYKKLLASPYFHLCAPTTMVEHHTDPSGVKATLDTGQILTAPLVIGCDGKQSDLRQQAGIPVKTLDYDQKALVGLIHHEKSHNNTAYEHFLKSGPLAILPMQDDADDRHQSGFIWSLKRDRADYFYGLSDDALASELQSYFGDILGKTTPFGNRWLFPLDAKVVKSYCAERLILIGDAAHAIHPVAGQGFNLGIRDAYALTTHMVKQRQLGLDYGSTTGLEAYEKSRRADVLSMTSMCHGLVRLFSNDVRTLDHLRKMGLSLTNAIPSLKDKLTKKAMGI